VSSEPNECAPNPDDTQQQISFHRQFTRSVAWLFTIKLTTATKKNTSNHKKLTLAMA